MTKLEKELLEACKSLLILVKNHVASANELWEVQESEQVIAKAESKTS